MRIAYLFVWDVHRETGVLKKILGQASAWRQHGHSVGLFAFASSSSLWEGLQHEPALHVVRRRPSWQAPARFALLVKRVLGWAPDVVYLRFCPYKPAMELLWPRVPVVLEVNTDDVSEFKRAQHPVEYAIHLRTRGRLFSKSAGVMSVTHEIADQLSDFDVPTAVIANGIKLTHYKTLPEVAESDDRPRFGFVGSAGCPWHGVDLIADLARQCPQWRFDVVGYKPDDLPSPPPDNVTCHGHQPREVYEAILARCDVAFGSMALHRNGMKEACPLKVREYLAYGLPVIIGYQDTDFLEGAPFILQLPLEQPQQASGAIGEFLQAWRHRRVEREQIEHLDFSFKETQRLELMSQWTGRRSDAGR